MDEGKERRARKVVLIIGGARGIGRGIVECWAVEGARVAIADISPERDPLAARLAGEDEHPGHPPAGRGNADARTPNNAGRFCTKVWFVPS